MKRLGFCMRRLRPPEEASKLIVHLVVWQRDMPSSQKHTVDCYYDDYALYY